MSEFLAITLLIFLSAISPGPDFAMVTKSALLHSRRAGVFTALGVGVSLLIHTTYCILGLAIVVTKSLLAFSIIKYVGAAYLIYIGIKSFFSRNEATTLDKPVSRHKLTAMQAFRQGVLCNLLNPKAIMFLLAFFTLIVKPGSSFMREAGYGLEMFIIITLWFVALSYLLTHRTVKANIGRIQHYVVKVMGGLLVLFGLRIATLHQSAL